MAYAMVAGMIISAAATTYSAYKQKEMADYNADLIKDQTKAEESRAKIEETRHREQLKKLMGTQRAMYGKSGMTMEGSPLLIMEETAAQGEIDAMLIRQTGRARKAELSGERALVKMGGRQALYGGTAQAGGSLLTGLGKYYA